jgi:hypothetical protein
MKAFVRHVQCDIFLTVLSRVAMGFCFRASGRIAVSIVTSTYFFGNECP